MNKKLLFGIMSLAALAACTNDDFESKNDAEMSEAVSPIQFEVINDNVVTRASMNGNSIVWNANDGDIFTLYHGGALAGTALSGYENAIYKANANEGGTATLTTPSMIKPGRAIMVWPADTMFYAAASGNLTVKIPATLENIENNIPYASDLITIDPYAAYSETAPAGVIPTAYKTAGKDRKYAVYMRPMASQLILKADYAGSDAVINALATGDDPIDPIALTSVEINDPTTSLTQEIDLSFAAPVAPQGTNWNTVANNVWTEVTGFNLASAVKAAKLTTKCINGIESAKFLMLPQNNIGGTGLGGASIVVNTCYGKVNIVQGTTPTTYTAAELADAWYRYAAAGAGAGTYTETETTTAGTGSDAGKVKYTNNIERGLAQVIDAFSGNKTTKATSVVLSEPTGAAGTRYVKVLLTKLDMDGLHVKTDKQLYDAVRVWKEIGAPTVTVNLDGDATTGEFEVSQKTIAKINEINAAAAKETTPRKFNVTACNVAGEACNTIVITGGGAVQNMDFIVNTVAAADVALKAGETWEWAASTTAAKTLTLAPAINTGVKSIINKGTFVSAATATLAIYDNTPVTPVQITAVPFVNEGTWNVTAGDVNVQFDVTNLGTVNISKGAEYHQDGTGNDFTNDANTLEERFVLNDPSIPAATKAAFVEQIGVVNNSGVFATVHGGKINNYGLIEHADKDAKTYITANDNGGTGFGAGFGATNKIGRINLPYSNKDEDNISISAGANKGFVSVTVSTEQNSAPANGKLSLATVGANVNNCIIKSGVTEINAVSTQIKYLEFNAGSTEIAWNLGGTASSPKAASYDGLIVLSPVNIKLWTNITVAKSTYLAAKMYVGGTFVNGTGLYNGYFGNTTANEATMYITY
jgi:hypothetical protein